MVKAMSDEENWPDWIWWAVGLVFVSAWCVFLYFFGPSLAVSPDAPELEGTGLRAGPSTTGHSMTSRVKTSRSENSRTRPSS